MMTEKGAVKSTTVYDKKFFAQVQKPAYISSAFVLVASAVLLIISVCSYTSAEPDVVEDIMMMVWSVIVFACGVFLIAALRFNANKALKLEKSVGYEIYSDSIVVTEYDKGEKAGTVRMFYSDFTKKGESKYYFQLFRTQAVAYYISKEGMTPAEMNAVRRTLGLKFKKNGGEEVEPLSAFVPADNFVAPADDIFGDLTDSGREEK